MAIFSLKMTKRRYKLCRFVMINTTLAFFPVPLPYYHVDQPRYWYSSWEETKEDINWDERLGRFSSSAWANWPHLTVQMVKVQIIPLWGKSAFQLESLFMVTGSILNVRAFFFSTIEKTVKYDAFLIQVNRLGCALPISGKIDAVLSDDEVVCISCKKSTNKF